jgi:hypothetical protein
MDPTFNNVDWNAVLEVGPRLPNDLELAIHN